MKKVFFSLFWFLWIFFACSIGASAQIGNVALQFGSSAPAGACPNIQTVYLRTSNGNLYTCPVGGGAWVLSGAGGGGTVGFSSITAGTNTAALVEGTGGSITPASLGQIAGNQLWFSYPPLLSAPSLAFSATGGSIASAATVYVKYTFVSIAGETQASVEALLQVSGCTGGTQCSVTVTAPTIPTGYTGYTVYSAVGSAGGELKQLAANACVNITGNCVIQAGGAGVAAPTTNTAFVTPAPLSASLCPTDVVPLWFVQDAAGNFQTQAGIDPSSNNISPAGTLEFCRRTWFNDTQISPPRGNNALLSVAHTAGTGTSASNQDRGISVVMGNPTTDSSTNRYGMEGIQSELDLNGNVNVNGSPDGELAAGSFQFSDSHTGAMASPSFQVGAIRAQAFASQTGTWGSCLTCMHGILGIVTNNSTTNQGGILYAGGQFQAIDQAGAVGVTGVSVEADMGNFTNNIGLFIKAGGAGNPILSQSLGVSPFSGPITIPTEAALSANTRAANTAYVDAAVAVGKTTGCNPVCGTPANVVNSSASIGATTLFTPTATGLYKINGYLAQSGSCTLIGPGGIVVNYIWTDEVGANLAASTQFMFANITGGNTNVENGIVLTYDVWAVAGQPIQYSTGYTACTTGTATYNVHINVTPN
jgi:hypothetical protein